MINIIVTTKTGKPGSFMNMQVEADSFDDVKKKLVTDDFLEGERLYVVRQDNGSLRVTGRADAVISTSSIASLQVSDLPITAGAA